MLREASRPFKNLLEYHGITASRLELMEARLRVRRGQGRRANALRVLLSNHVASCLLGSWCSLVIS